MAPRPSRRKILTASVGVAAVSYVVGAACADVSTSGNLPAPPPTSGNLPAPYVVDAGEGRDGSFVTVGDGGTARDASSSDAGDAGDGGR